MLVKSIKTHKITTEDRDIFQILDRYIGELKERSILAVTSKIVSICEGNVVKVESANKEDLIVNESQFFIPSYKNRYNVALTVKNNALVASAGIDQSNGNGYYILWPKDPQKSANKIREYLAKKFNLKKFGVVITDSKTTPLRWGVTGTAIAHSGFAALNDLIGKPDIFGQILRITKVNIADGLAAAAVLVMGEGAEQTPLAIIDDLSQVEFQDRNPTTKELDSLRIEIEDDLYAALLKGVKWDKGKI